MSDKASAVLPRASRGQVVLVTTREKIAGENEHAALVTRVVNEDVVNVMLLPDGGQPYPVPAVCHVRYSPLAAMTWRHRPRERT